MIALLIVGWSTPARIISLVIYGLSLIFLFSASATYHIFVMLAAAAHFVAMLGVAFLG